MAVEIQPAEDAEPHAPFYIPASETTSISRQHVLKYGDAFAVLDHNGNAQASGPSAEGLFFEDTRYLSQLMVTINGAAPLLLSSAIDEDNSALLADFTNAEIGEVDGPGLLANSIHLLRRITLAKATLFHTIELRNFSTKTANFQLNMRFSVDFVDLFEVRGTSRPQRGEFLPLETGPGQITLGYRGLDGVARRTRITYPSTGRYTEDGVITWPIKLAAHDSLVLDFAIRCQRDGRPFEDTDPKGSAKYVEQERADRLARAGEVYTSNARFNDWMNRSRADLDMLTTRTEHGLYTYAGVPWFSTPFGRDGIITALQCLWLDPELAAGTLRYLAATQATSFDDQADAEPGKILHETRQGEMAALGEVPFARYYGSIDSTPLFVMLASAYHARTGDTALIRDLWPAITAAIRWMTDYGDIDGDGFLEYGRRSAKGLINQGWKDSLDSVFYADGTLANGPIALAEVQAYAYEAFVGGAGMAAVLDKPDAAASYTASAVLLRERFEASFWSDELKTYVLALDGKKRPCAVRSSNAGQVLLSGLPSPERAAMVGETLSEPMFLSGWGIRTLADNEIRYNPLSYHNGSVWPHDNALIAMGFARHGLKQPLLTLFSQLFDASLFLPLQRLPELYCGFPRRRGVGPTGYPVACIPQAWSSAAALGVLGAVLGVSFDPEKRAIRFRRPSLPTWLTECRIGNLRLGEASVDLLLRRTRDDVALQVLERRGDVQVVVTL